ncbi:replication initiator protein [Blackfly microvirus SF02]|uniref:Replication initiator protein n=1 Tax=Blackfly microvirus SF02 TaxID=2576452 RepID=A0A4P8PK23_9VIRU|nr:replication initiator protein [Blackfly microvirus SF02]
MPCYHPKEVWHGKLGGISWNKYNCRTGPETPPFHIPCNQCIGCRLDKSRAWALRLSHEAKMHKRNCFVTLTYSDESLPEAGNLVPDHVRLFMKTLRKKRKVRFYACGEYGEQTRRPHYHAILFGQDFTLGARRIGGSDDSPLFHSDELTNLWGRGHTTVGHVTSQSCAYVARYVVKKINGVLAEQHYTVNHNGKPFVRLPEFARMSRRPGIGETYFKKYGMEACQHDSVIVNGKPVPPPPYYHRLLTRVHELREQIPDPRRPERKLDDRQWTGETLVQEIKKRRVKKARTQKADNTPERLAVREKHATLIMKKRNL